MEIIPPGKTADNCPAEAAHANPRNLRYLLLKGTNMPFSLTIVQKKIIEISWGEIELAIIAESHYCKFGNLFTEIVTCAKPESVASFPVIKSGAGDQLCFVHHFEGFRYETKICSEQKHTPEAFKEEERRIANQENTLFHFFEEDTALTALRLRVERQFFSLETKHSYPAFQTIVRSKTIVRPKQAALLR